MVTLAADHQAVSEVLKQLLSALNNEDVLESHRKLDLLWARLAVHIRAEHLHLFPTVIERLKNLRDAIAPKLHEPQTIVEKLHEDHDFFMRELGQAIRILRELPKPLDSAENKAKLSSVLNTVREVERRLASHNETEENQIYRWASMILTEAEQAELTTRINRELQHRPPRFSLSAWENR